MLKKTINYTDYDGVNRTEDFYFNITKAELVEMELVAAGGKGFADSMQAIVDSNDGKQIIGTFKKIIFQAYGEKSEDGKRFIKSEELSQNFSYTEAYSNLFVELTTDAEASAAFVNGIVPAELSQPKAGLTSAEARARSEENMRGHRSPVQPEVAQSSKEPVELMSVADQAAENDRAELLMLRERLREKPSEGAATPMHNDPSAQFDFNE